MTPDGILETVLYARDLEAAEGFYATVMGMEVIAREAGRHVFFRCGDQVFLVFNPEVTVHAPASGALPVPPHGASGAGHVCFRIALQDIDGWRRHLETHGVAIEADFHWPGSTARSLYFRDPAGNCLELAPAELWGLRKVRRLEPGTRLVVASHNAGKVREIDDLLKPFGIDAVSAADLGLPEPEETEESFAGNARLKALAAARASGLPALADDSGLCVDALNGAPGIHSARWAGPQRDFALAMRNVEERLQARKATSPEARRAHFICALCLAWPDGTLQVFEGRIDGALVWPPRGENGFGYDPVFQPDGHAETFGEMPPLGKHAMSHRARAFEKFMHLIAGQDDPD